MGERLARLRRFAADESGATAIEYALIGGLVSLVAIGAMRSYGTSLVNLFTVVDDTIAGATTPPGGGGGGGCPPPPPGQPATC